MIYKDPEQEAILAKLVEADMISAEQSIELNKIAQAEGKNIVELVKERKLVNDDELTKIRSEVTGIPYIDLADKKIKPEVLNLIPQELAENYAMVPWQRIGNDLNVGMTNPRDYKAVEALDFIARQNGLKINYYLISENSLKMILRCYESLSAEVEAALEKAKEDDVAALGEEATEEEGVEEVYKTAPISKMVSVIVRHAVEGEASDVHIEPVGDQTRVRFRMDGVLHTSIVLPRNVLDGLVARIKVLANLKLDETRLPQDGRFRMKIEGRKIDFRVATLPLAEDEKVTLRILDTKSSTQDLEGLGFVGRNLELVKKYIKLAHGMFLATGPTGSGKSTTLYALLTLLNKESVNIVTLEDPIEYSLSGISQSQINPKIGLTFANGLRSILRQDPDIIMVGEVRDDETAELVTHAALTGHKVLSTLHTNNALGAVPRLIDMGIEPFLIASSLKMVVAQRLIRKICEKCKQEDTSVPDKLKEELIKELSVVPTRQLPKEIDLQNIKLYEGKGCPRCEDTGYHGRTAVIEVIEMTANLEKIINSDHLADKETVKEELDSQGMTTMKADGFIKALQGLTTVEEVIKVTQE